MTAYLIANIPFSDSPAARTYRERVPAVIAAYGGRYVVRGGPIEVLEGRPMDDRRIVVVAFPDRDTARRFYHSPEYQEIIALRQEETGGDLVVVDGYEG